MTNATAAIDCQRLSAALRASTSEAHERAEHSDFMENLAGGQLDAQAFRRLQDQSWFIYTSLEEAGDAVREDPRAAGIVDARLERREALAADLDALHGSSAWREEITPTAATQAYVERLAEIRDERDVLGLIAHHYVRYLGDLSGGQIVARMMKRHYGLEDEALNFYHFTDIPKPKPFKDDYRASLDALGVTEEERRHILDEASRAFDLNLGVFQSLA